MDSIYRHKRRKSLGSTEGTGQDWWDWGFPRGTVSGRGEPKVEDGGLRSMASLRAQTLLCVYSPPAALPPLCQLWKEGARPRCRDTSNGIPTGLEEGTRLDWGQPGSQPAPPKPCSGVRGRCGLSLSPYTLLGQVAHSPVPSIFACERAASSPSFP